jgi:hypothetical protein
VSRVSRTEHRRRVIRQALVCLLFGAAINVSVAWMCAYHRPRPAWSGATRNTLWFRTRDAGAGRMHWWGSEIGGLGWSTLQVIHDRTDRVVVGPPGSVTHPLIESVVQAHPGIEAARVEIAGWPFRSFAATATAVPGDARVVDRHAITITRTPWTTLVWSDWRGAITLDGPPAAVGFNRATVLPIRPLVAGFAANTSIYAVAAGALIAGVSWMVRRLATPAGHCPKCRYDLRGDLARGCPECGWGRVESPATAGKTAG